jgi:hypothetical protein
MHDDLKARGGRMARMTVDRLGVCGAGHDKRCPQSGDPQQLDCTHDQPLPFGLTSIARILHSCDEFERK